MVEQSRWIPDDSSFLQPIGKLSRSLIRDCESRPCGIRRKTSHPTQHSDRGDQDTTHVRSLFKQSYAPFAAARYYSLTLCNVWAKPMGRVK